MKTLSQRWRGLLLKPVITLSREELEAIVNFHRWVWGCIAYLIGLTALLLLLDYLWRGEFYFS